MLRDITLGQYYPADSVIHRLDPRVKLFGTMVFILSLFIFKGPIALGLVAVFLIAMIRLSKVPFSYMVKGLKAVVVLMVITSIFHVFFTPGTELFRWGVIKITMEGLKNAGLMLIRLSFLITGTSLMTLTTTPNQLTDGLEKSLHFMNKLHVPVHEVAMMMSIALRFIPILIEELDKIMKAQMARGADFESGTILQKAKAMIPLLVPLIVSAFRRANDLAMAMEARCYKGGDGRTKMKPLRYARRDVVAYLILTGYFTGVVALRIFWKTYGGF